MKSINHKTGTLATATALALFSMGATAGDGMKDKDYEHQDKHSVTSEISHEAKDAWLQGKLETVYMLNRHLNAFTIDTEVKNGVAYLSGTVESDVDRSLAEQIAEGIDGIRDVKSTLVIDPESTRREVAASMRDHDDDDKHRSFGQWVDDSTTTAAVKSALIGEDNIKARNINVDTRYDVVTLTGRVATSEEKDLAEQIAKNTTDVRDVRNMLAVGPK